MKKLLGIFLITILSLSAYAYEINFKKDDVCVMRNLKLSSGPKWVSEIKLHNGKVALFCSAKSMLEFFYKPKTYKEYNYFDKSDIEHMLVTDYITLEAIDATKAYYVYGSSVISPAGDDLVTFKNLNDAKRFSAKNNGRRVLPFDKVSLGLVKLLNGDI